MKYVLTIDELFSAVKSYLVNKDHPELKDAKGKIYFVYKDEKCDKSLTCEIVVEEPK